MIKPEQCRAARSMLNWTQKELADGSEIGLSTVIDFESGARTPIKRNLTAIQSALEAAGIEFIPENGGGPGVRLRKLS